MSSPLVVLSAFLVVFLLVVKGQADQGCNITLGDHYPTTNPHIESRLSQEVNYFCSFSANCPIHGYFSRQTVKEGETHKIKSQHWISSGYRYFESMSYSNAGVTLQLQMPTFSVHYAAFYSCTACDLSYSSNCVTKKFQVTSSYSDYEQPRDCFLPMPENITVVYKVHTPDNVTATISWDVTNSTDPLDQECDNGRFWKLGVAKYDNVEDTPNDMMPVTGAKYHDVPEEEVTYMVTGLNSHTYYMFAVDHRVTKEESEPTTSYVYYFGPQVPPTITNSQKEATRNLYVGSSYSVECLATGIPTPKAEWITTQSGTYPNNNTAILDLKDVTKEDSGIYFCRAYNIHVNPPEGKREVGIYWDLNVAVLDYSSDETGLTCSAIQFADRGSVCREYMNVHPPQYDIFTNISETDKRETTASDLLNQIDTFLPEGECRSLAHSIACHSVYPYCDARRNYPTPRRVCKSACDEFITGSCSGDNGYIVYNLLKSRCSNTTREGGTPVECIPLGLDSARQGEAPSIVKTGNCMRGNGRGYSGSVSRTVSNAHCQSWNDQTPHGHPMVPEVFTELKDAGDSCRNPGGLGTRPWCYTGNRLIRWEYCDVPLCDSCEPYNGQFCANINNYDSANVIVRRGTNIENLQDIEDKISHMSSRTILKHQVSGGCAHILTTLLCHAAFPHCTSVDETKELCHEHCQLVDTLERFCPEVHEEFENFLEESDFLSDLKCEKIAEKNSSQCMPLPQLGNGNISDSERDCYSGNGERYRGNISKTQSGTPCQYWASDVPHEHTTKPAYYPELEQAANYCRNPGGLGTQPWCYTSGETEWEYCNVPQCDTANDPIITDGRDEIPSSGLLTETNNNGVIATVIVTMVIVVIAVFGVGALIFGILYMRGKKRRLRKDIIPMDFRKMAYNSNTSYIRQQVKEEEAEKLIIPDNFRMLSSKQITYASQLGQGNFGVVFKGLAYNIKNDNEEMEVAVKTLKEEASFEVKQSFIDEAKLMFNFDHPNILKIHGVCMDQMPYQMVFEYMDEGDLTQFLRQKASSAQRRLTTPFRSRTESSYSNNPPSLSKTELLYICKQIAAGMVYLSDRQHVHRDLACRNCLIKSDLVVKIGDFGMSRNLYTRDYYRVNGSAVLPVRWMSPESLIYGKFSKEGDVWSFGVVMWEVFSFALQPYYGTSNEEVTEAIRRGKYLNRPDDCPTEIYRLMLDCWNMDPSYRPEFGEIFDTLTQLHTNSSVSEQVECDTSDNTDDDEMTDDPLSDSLFEHDSDEPDFSETESAHIN